MVVYSGSSDAQVLLAYDSSNVRRLLADENAREEEINESFWRSKHTEEDASKRIRDIEIHPDRYLQEDRSS